MAQPVDAEFCRRRAAKRTSAELDPPPTSAEDAAPTSLELEPPPHDSGASTPCRPVWHRPWKRCRVMSGHSRCVRSIAFDPGNNWFCTGSDDRTIKVWDIASGQLKLTLNGHVLPVRGLAVSSKHPYLFSAGEDKEVKCWDLEYSKRIRSYRGHLSGVHCLTLHPTLDLVLTGGRDSTCRVWDMRTKAQVYTLSGHRDTVSSVMAQAMDPQVITGSHDTTIKLWDFAAGKYMSTLTLNDKRPIRALAKHPCESSFASASTGCIKTFRLPKGEFLTTMSTAKQGNILHCAAVNKESVMVSGGDDGSLCFWDWSSGHNFQRLQTKGQPGSLECEQAIYALSYDVTGTRLVTCEADKTVKMWKQDENATPCTHPLDLSGGLDYSEL